MFEKPMVHVRKAFQYDQFVYDLLAPHVNGGTVLSVGCGEGRVEAMLHDQRGIPITGAEVTKYKEQKIPVELYDGKSLPFRDKSFDTSLFVYMLHHTNDIASLLREAQRVTRKEILILDHTYTNVLSKQLLKLYDYWVNVMYGMPIPFNFLRVNQWKRLFHELGLTVTEGEIPSSLNVFFKLRV